MVSGKYPVLPFWLQAERQFGYELGDLLHCTIDVMSTNGPVCGTL